MSDCGVCVFSGYEGEPNDMFSESLRTARKPHKCGECGKVIAPGERYAYYRGKSGGDFWTAFSCLVCDEIADAFCCDGRIFGNLWEGMYEVHEGLTTACFDRLRTPEAKAELRRRWMTWKGLAA